MLNWRSHCRIRSKQRGASAVEFGIIAMVFFTLFFGIIEFGRFFYLYNTVQEVTRCAARQAVVTWKGNNDDWSGTTIRQQCLFGHGELVAGWEIHGADIRLRALNLAFGVADPDSVEDNISNCVTNQAGPNCIRFVEASLWCSNGDYCDTVNNRIRYKPMFGLIPLRVNIPNSTVRMPAESLGYGT